MPVCHISLPRAAVAVLAVLAWWFAAGPAPAAPPAQFDAAAAARAVEARLKEHGDGAVGSVWVGGPAGGPWLEVGPAGARPTASAIKSFFLVELFAAHAGKLDAPLPGGDTVLDDDRHPAISHFTPEQRAEIRKQLRGASVRQVGEVMTGKTRASNAVYNAAANLATAVLGGPDGLTGRIRDREAAFQGVAVRRYMLRNRTMPGDNEAPAAALAALYQRLASRQLRGVDAGTMRAVRRALLRKEEESLGTEFGKTGSLTSDPLTAVRSGWWETPGGIIVFVVMLSQPTPGGRERTAASQRLGETADAIADRVVQAARTAIGRRPPVVEGNWVRPNLEKPAEPVWGVRGGLAVGLWPTVGPRGLIRVYAPYLGHRPGRVVNFISVEPVVKGVRGQSELEVGLRDRMRGLSMCAADTREGLAAPGDLAEPVRGVVGRDGRVETLTVYLATEPFRNGASPVICVMFRADRPHEVGLRVYSAAGGAAMDSCVLSATMGNYGRLRRLWLRGEVADARKVWPTFEPDRLGFAPWRKWGRDRLLRVDGDVVVAAASDEPDPARAEYDPKVPQHWRYTGKPATHYWRARDAAGLVARVNGRDTYWGGGGPIPGGTAYENFELEAPFADGQEFRFGVSPEPPSALGFDPAWGTNVTAGK